MAYASTLTKEDLIKEGITEITKDGRIFKGDIEIFPYWNLKNTKNRYLCINIYKRNEDGTLVKGKDRVRKYTRKDGSVEESISWNGISRLIGLHRAMWAWHYGEVPKGMVVDHINNQHLRIEDYHLDNLQLLTPRENLGKERDSWDIRELKCKLTFPRSHYEEKLIDFIEKYEEAKIEGDPKKCHKFRSQVANYRAKLRYWDSHKDEYEEYTTTKETEKISKEKWRQSVRDRKRLEQYKQKYKELGNKRMWHQICQIIKSWDALDSAQKEHIFKVLLEKNPTI